MLSLPIIIKRGYSFRKKSIFLFLVLLLIIKVVTWIIFPYPGIDGPIYLSHTFSVLKGDFFRNNFLSGYIPVFNFPYLFGVLNAPFYYFFSGTGLQVYSIFLCNILWICLFLAGVFTRFRDAGHGSAFKYLLFASAYLTNVYTFSLRSEIFILPFFIMLEYFLVRSCTEHHKLFTWIFLPLLIAVIGLMHPVAGLIACVFAVLFFWEEKIPARKLLLLMATTGAFIMILYLPVVLIDFGAWKQNFFQIGFLNREHSFFDISPFLKYCSYNPATLFLILFTIFCSPNRKKEILYIAVFLIAIIYFHQSYYFEYLYVLLFWRMKKNEMHPVQSYIVPIFVLLCFYGFTLVCLLPLFQLSENPSYINCYNRIQQYFQNDVPPENKKTVWVPGDFCMSVLNREDIRLHWSYILDYKQTMQAIDTTVSFFVTNRSQMDYIARYPYVAGTHLAVKNIIQPVKGLVTVSSDFKRSDSLGLWKIQVVNNRQ